MSDEKPEDVNELRRKIHAEVLQLFKDSNISISDAMFISISLMAVCIHQSGQTTDEIIPVIHKMLDELLKDINRAFTRSHSNDP